MNLAHLKLGKGPVKHDARTLMLSKYLTTVPTPPKAIDFSQKVPDWGMMENDTLGDCTCAALGHQIQLWTATVGKPFTPPDLDVVKAYSAVSGYDINTGANDNGAVELDVLNYARKVGMSGHKIEAFVSVDHSKTSLVKSSIQLFEGCYIGLALPVSAQTQFIWDTGRGSKYAPGSWGGHAVIVVGYDADTVTCITWGRALKMTWRFFKRYCEEAYALLSMDMVAGGKCPAGFDVTTLRKDLSLLAA